MQFKKQNKNHKKCARSQFKMSPKCLIVSEQIRKTENTPLHTSPKSQSLPLPFFAQPTSSKQSPLKPFLANLSLIYYLLVLLNYIISIFTFKKIKNPTTDISVTDFRPRILSRRKISASTHDSDQSAKVLPKIGQSSSFSRKAKQSQNSTNQQKAENNSLFPLFTSNHRSSFIPLKNENQSPQNCYKSTQDTVSLNSHRTLFSSKNTKNKQILSKNNLLKKLENLISKKIGVKLNCEAEILGKVIPESGRFKASFKVCKELVPEKMFIGKHLVENQSYLIRSVDISDQNDSKLSSAELLRILPVIQSLDHPNIARYISSWVEEINDFPFLGKSQQSFASKNIKENNNRNKSVSDFSKKKADFCKILIEEIPFVSQMENKNCDFSKFEIYFDDQLINPTVDFPDSQSRFLRTSSLSHLSGNNFSVNEIEQNSIVKKPKNRLSFSALKFYTQLEFLDGFSLDDWLQNSKVAFADDEIFCIFSQLLSVLEFLRTKKIALSQISGEDVFVSKKGIVKITDLSKVRLFESDLCSPFNSGLIFQKENDLFSKNQFLLSSDLSDLGILLFELLSNFPTNHQRLKAVQVLKTQQKTSVGFEAEFGVRAVLIDSLVQCRRTGLQPQNIKSLESYLNWQTIVENTVNENVS